MALPQDWMKLYTKWSNKLFTSGDPKLDALYEIYLRQGLTVQEREIIVGNYFSGHTELADLETNQTLYRVVKANSLYFILESFQTTIDYGDTSDGNYNYRINLYIENSNQNDWSYTGGVSLPFGRPLNTDFINKPSASDFIFDPAVTLTGREDFVLMTSNFIRDTAGNRDTITGTQGFLLEDGRKIIIPPNTSALIEIIVVGKNNSTATIISDLNYIEAGELIE